MRLHVFTRTVYPTATPKRGRQQESSNTFQFLGFTVICGLTPPAAPQATSKYVHSSDPHLSLFSREFGALEQSLHTQLHCFFSTPDLCFHRNSTQPAKGPQEVLQTPFPSGCPAEGSCSLVTFLSTEKTQALTDCL